MATLHVRNVPEPLYEALRTRSEREGRSIGSQTCVLLEQALLVETLKLPGRRGSAAAIPPSERLAQPARDAIAQAGKEAVELGHDVIDTEHVLLALLADGESVAARVLGALGVGRDAVLERLTKRTTRSKRRTKRPLPLTPAVKHVLELALREALARGGLGQGSIDTEHVAIGLALEEQGRAAQILRELGVDASMVRTEALRTLALGRAQVSLLGPMGPPATAWQYRTLDLTGDSEAWSQQLNDAAAEGWELFSVTEREATRAILRRAVA